MRRASAPGAHTTEAPVKRDRITLRGFRLQGSSAQGVYWVGGDDVVLEDLVVSDNGSSPAILFEYPARTGLSSANLTVRNNHLLNVTGECVYVGGAENTGGDGVRGVTVAHNLIHGCGTRGHHGDDWDGINVKDGDAPVLIEGNVVFDANRGVQLDSPATVSHNVLADLASDGVTLGDGWTSSVSGAVLTDNAVIRCGGAGVYASADLERGRDLTVDRLTTVEASEGGLLLAAEQGLTGSADNLVFSGGPGLAGWGRPDVALGACATDTRPAGIGALEGATCDAPAQPLGDLIQLAGPDHAWLTADDGWVTPLGARPPE